MCLWVVHYFAFIFLKPDITSHHDQQRMNASCGRKRLRVTIDFLWGAIENQRGSSKLFGIFVGARTEGRSGGDLLF